MNEDKIRNCRKFFFIPRCHPQKVFVFSPARRTKLKYNSISHRVAKLITVFIQLELIYPHLNGFKMNGLLVGWTDGKMNGWLYVWIDG